jgi:hypothetical protein
VNFGSMSIDPHVMKNAAWMLVTFASDVTGVSRDLRRRANVASSRAIRARNRRSGCAVNSLPICFLIG